MVVAAALMATVEQTAELERMAASTSLPHRQVVQARGTFTSVAELTEAITTWAAHWNTNPKPFIWKATAEDIITKVRRGRNTLNQLNSQTDH